MKGTKKITLTYLNYPLFFQCGTAGPKLSQHLCPVESLNPDLSGEQPHPK